MRSLRLVLLGLLVLAVSGLVFSPLSEAQQGYGMHPGMWGGGPGYNQGGGWSYCPYCGSPRQGGGGYPMGPGMMGPGYGRQGMGPGMMGPGYGRQGMGPGMMGPGYGQQGMGPGMMGPGYGNPYNGWNDRGYRPYSEPLKKEDARNEVGDMLKESGNPNLKLGDVEEEGRYYVVGILTQDGSLVDKLQVDKDTGMMRSIYGR